jgi:hypothetical protein
VTAAPHHGGVTPQSTERTGVLVLRIWTEDGQAGVVRARISSTTGLDSTPPSTAVAGSLDDIRALVAAFLEAFVGTTSP